MKPTYEHPWYRESGVVYFVAAGNPPAAVKIGVTKLPAIADRLRKLQTHNHEIIELLGVILFNTGEKPMREAEVAEAAIHRRFRTQQRFAQGWVGHEWFTPSDDLLEFIRHSSTPPEEVQPPLPRFAPNVQPVSPT